jgi:hypothetical protein
MQNELAKELIEEHIASVDEIRSMTPEQLTQFLATKFLSFNKRNALNILLMCKIFYDLKNRPIFKNFLQKIKVKDEQDSSQFKKYYVIGKNFDKLVNYVDMLPSTWSTIYKIAEYAEDRLTNMKSIGILHPTVTANEIDDYLARTLKVSNKRKKDASRIRISISETLSQTELEEVIGTLEEMKSRHLIDFEIPETIQVTCFSHNDRN